VGAANTKAKARKKLRVRIWLSPVLAGAARRFGWPFRNDAPFPEFSVEVENGFFQQEIVSSLPSNETAARKYQ
jgi:hypothetical protein